MRWNFRVDLDRGWLVRALSPLAPVPARRILLALLVAALSFTAAPAHAARVAYVVDGDTIRLKSGAYVRLIGIDTPEVGQCGYRAAKRKLDLVGRPFRRRTARSGTGTPRTHAGHGTRHVYPS